MKLPYQIKWRYQQLRGKMLGLSGEALWGRLRKQQHLDLCRYEHVETLEKAYGFSELSFVPQAAPELNWDDLVVSAQFLGRTFAAPLLISGMTGGVEAGERINRRLAAAAAHLGIPLGLGSQRVACENPRHTGIFTMKKQHPNLYLLGNIGCAQLVLPGGLDLAKKAVEMVEADALVVHLNVLQECIQQEGNRNFAGFLQRLEELCSQLGVPVLVKEVGCGISVSAAERLLACGIAALDIAGKGGTSWGYIEGLRSNSPAQQQLGASFRNWGIPTAYSLVALRRRFPEAVLIASGGVRDGLTVAKAVALGAQLVGVALPLMQAALISEEAVVASLETIIRGLKITMLATGSRTTTELSSALCSGQALGQEFYAGLEVLRKQSHGE